MAVIEGDSRKLEVPRPANRFGFTFRSVVETCLTHSCLVHYAPDGGILFLFGRLQEKSNWDGLCPVPFFLFFCIVANGYRGRLKNPISSEILTVPPRARTKSSLHKS